MHSRPPRPNISPLRSYYSTSPSFQSCLYKAAGHVWESVSSLGGQKRSMHLCEGGGTRGMIEGGRRTGRYGVEVEGGYCAWMETSEWFCSVLHLLVHPSFSVTLRTSVDESWEGSRRRVGLYSRFVVGFLYSGIFMTWGLSHWASNV